MLYVIQDQFSWNNLLTSLPERIRTPVILVLIIAFIIFGTCVPHRNSDVIKKFLYGDENLKNSEISYWVFTIVDIIFLAIMFLFIMLSFVSSKSNYTVGFILSICLIPYIYYLCMALYYPHLLKRDSFPVCYYNGAHCLIIRIINNKALLIEKGNLDNNIDKNDTRFIVNKNKALKWGFTRVANKYGNYRGGIFISVIVVILAILATLAFVSY